MLFHDDNPHPLLLDSVHKKRTSKAMKQKKKRLWYTLIFITCLGATTALVLNALRSQITYFYTPSDTLPTGQNLRLGGLVKEGSVAWHKEKCLVNFLVTDGTSERKIHYTGVLPDLFREGQGVVVEGVLSADGTLQARKILAKHDEAYMPPEIAKALKNKGLWRAPANVKKDPCP